MRHTILTLSAICLAAATAGAQATSLRIVDEDGAPVIGATVELLGTTLDGAVGQAATFISDDDGTVAYDAALAPDRFRVRYIGYAPVVTRLSDLSLDDAGQLQLRITPAQEVLAQAVVRAVRARPSDPFAFENVDGEALATANPGQDIPFLLRRTPGAVYTSDAGTGIGYSGIRVRGADATRVNVTINGVPLNDSESQGVFWVNMPDFVSSTSSLQLQRGVGQSTYGAGAFGANLNLVTNAPTSVPQLTAELGGGSFGTFRSMLRANSGDIGGFSVEARASYISSEGFVDRASSRLGSAYLGTSYAISDRQRIQLIGWTGHERTYQSWFGIPASFAASNSLRTFNPAGERADGSFYEDQVDDYGQSHAQLLYSLSLDSDFLLQLTGHYTHGRGYFEEWDIGGVASDYFPGATAVDGEPGLARRRWLDNDFFGAIATVSGALSPKLNTTLSAGYSRYYGEHYGTLSLVRIGDVDFATDDRYYDNDATKDDFNAFAKTNWQAARHGNLYLDLQLRHVRYEADFVPGEPAARRSGEHTFFNPKLGWTQRLDGGFGASPRTPSSAYASLAVGQREPNRSDFENAPAGVTPRAETLYDLELGLRSHDARRFTFEAGGYYMYYDDQLAVTGALNESGEQVRANVDESYRMGVELSAGYRLTAAEYGGGGWRLDGNLALSRNRVSRYSDLVPVFDEDFALAFTREIVREDVPLAFSPGVIANLGLSYRRPLGRGLLDAALWGSYVSEQFVDNSGEEVAALPAYARADLELRYHPRLGGRVTVTLQVQNLTGHHPVTNGYGYRYSAPAPDIYSVEEGSRANRFGGRDYFGKGVYPQAGLQVLAGVQLQLTGAAR